MSKVFQFQQFSVDQTNCGMKVNTDAAILGAIATNDNINSALEIGTGTGVIALMLAQRYPEAQIDAVEIDEMASLTAELNFRNSPFSDHIQLVKSSFQAHFSKIDDKKYDLIISNPPYFVNALKSDDTSKRLARHTDVDFFQDLISGASIHLSLHGLLYLILPLDTAELVKSLLSSATKLVLKKTIFIHSFPESKPYRCIMVIGLGIESAVTQKFVIYNAQNSYTEEYRVLLKDYLTIF
ncbi:MAG: methyltransferase [Daejeonella sp.]|uniref:tRNA1(Val) (adenine(37)-N6)-methyltransferase n=1 Tax=Daejeonella sp. TaxID=2805397 RepID=UPI003C7755C1